MSANMVALAYLVASVFFILALKGLSSPESARRGNLFGMVGMAIAVATTLTLTQNWPLILGCIAVGGIIGALVAQRVQMTAMPELVAFMHSLVGLAAVFLFKQFTINSFPSLEIAGFCGNFTPSTLKIT